MISISVYLSVEGGDPTKPLERLGIQSQNVFGFEDENISYEFFDRRENAALFQPVQGDFNFAMDLTFFDWDENGLNSVFLDLSKSGHAVAVPDEGAESPFAYKIYEDGQVRDVDILTDELTDEVRVHPAKERSDGTA